MIMGEPTATSLVTWALVGIIVGVLAASRSK